MHDHGSFIGSGVKFITMDVPRIKVAALRICPNCHFCFTAYSRSPAIHDDTDKLYISEQVCVLAAGAGINVPTLLNNYMGVLFPL